MIIKLEKDGDGRWWGCTVCKGQTWDRGRKKPLGCSICVERAQAARNSPDVSSQK